MDYNDVNPKWPPSTTESPFIFLRLHLQLTFIHLAGASIQNDLQLLYICQRSQASGATSLSLDIFLEYIYTAPEV